METVPVKQQKFSGGEISPLLYGDTSLPKYGMSAKQIKNWIPTPQGPLVSRPGTRYIVETNGNNPVRTKGFTFPDGRSYILVFGDLTLRFLRAGAQVEVVGLPGVPYQVATPWTAAMLPYLKFAQAGNVVTICYGGQYAGDAGLAPQDLLHAANDDRNWTLSATVLVPPTVTYNAPPGNPRIVLANSQQTGTTDWPAHDVAKTYQIGDRVSYLNQSWISIQSGNLNHLPGAASLYWTLANDSSHPGVQVSYAMTNVLQDPVTGVTFETAFAGPGFAYSDALSADRPVNLNVRSGIPITSSYVVMYSRLYKGTSGVWGWMADLATAGTGGVTYIDLGTAPDYTQQPPRSTDPFLVNSVDQYPAVVSHWEQRRYFARSSVLPQTFWGSRIGNLISFDRFVPGSDADSVLFTIASEVLEEIRSFAPMRVALIMTAAGEWSLSGATGAATTRSNFNLKRQSQWGSSWLDPVIVGNGVVFNTAKSNMVRDLFPMYGMYTDIWDGDDLTFPSRHLFEGHTIVAWAYQATPYSVLWAVRDDGVLLSLTYHRTSRNSIAEVQVPVVAWARHDTIGFVENVAVASEAPEDAVYLVVRRTISGVTKRYHERMANVLKPVDPRYAECLDSAVSFDGHYPSGSTISIAGAAYTAGSVVTCTCTAGVFSASDEGASAVVLNPDTVQADGRLGVKAPITHYTDPTHVEVTLDADLTAAQIAEFTAGSTDWALAKSSFWVPHLMDLALDSGEPNGARGVAILGDGYPSVTNATYVGGTLTLQDPRVVVHVGLSYNCDLELLDAYHANAEIRNRFKSLVRMGFHVASARGLWVGKDFATLYQWVQRAVSDQYGALAPGTGYFEEFVADDWNKDGSGALRQWEPLPCSLLGVLREMVLGGT